MKDILTPQMCDQRRGTICLFKNCNSAEWSSISTMRVANFRGNKSKRRHCTRCWNTLQRREVQLQSRYTQRWCRWSVPPVTPSITESDDSLRPTCSVRYHPRSTHLETPSTQRRTNLCWSSPGHTCRLFTSSFYDSSKARSLTRTLERDISIRPLSYR